MSTVPSPAPVGGQPATADRGSAFVVVATALGGVLAVVVWLAWSYSFATAHHGVENGRHLAPAPYWSQFVLIPLVAFIGARLAPGRLVAVVAAACGPQVLFVLAMKGSHLLQATWLSLDLWLSEVALVVLTWLAARTGRRLAAR